MKVKTTNTHSPYLAAIWSVLENFAVSTHPPLPRSAYMPPMPTNSLFFQVLAEQLGFGDFGAKEAAAAIANKKGRKKGS